MSRPYRCDECADEPEEPIHVYYPVTPEEEDDLEIPDDEEAHFCSWACLAQFAMREALEQGETVVD